jgi:hypothetical protein
MKKTKSRIHYIRNNTLFNPKKISDHMMKKSNIKIKNTSNRAKNKNKFTEKQINKTKKFEIKKENECLSNFNPTVNYFNEYWKMYYENEYILAKIKETVYEINLMQAHLEELNNINSNLEN